MNLAGTPVTRAVLVEEVLEIMNAVKDNVTDADIVEELEKKGIVCDCHMNFVRDIRDRALDVRNDDQCTMEELYNKFFPKTRRGKKDKYHSPTTKKSGDQCPPEFKRQKYGNSDIKKKKGMIQDLTLAVTFYAMPRPRLRMLRARRALFLQQDCSL